VSASAKSDSHSVDLALDSLLCQHFTAVDQHGCVLLDLDSTMSELSHELASVGWTLGILGSSGLAADGAVTLG